MKKHFSIFLGLMVVFSSLFVSCNDDDLDPNICKITVKSDGNGTVSITDYIGTSVNVFIGNRVEVVAVPDNGYAFIGWYLSESETPVSIDAAFTFITSENVTLTARFAKLSDIIIRSGGNGSVAFKDAKGNSIPVLPGTEVTVIATPDVDCDFVGWFIGDSETPISTEAVYTFTVTENIILTGQFSKRPVVTIRSAGNGSVSFKDYSGTSIAVLPGTEVTVVATPDVDCDFVGWFIGDSETPISTEAVYTFTVTENIILTGQFSKRPVVTIRSAGNGSVSFKDYSGTSIAVLPGTEVTVIATPDVDCDFVGWFVDEDVVSTEQTFIYNVDNDVVLVAKFNSSIYINETFAKSFGVFTPVETVGNFPWIIDYSTAKATSYVDGANNAATSWIISAPVDFTEETEAYVSFDYIIRYSESGKVAAYHQLLISTDYTGNVAEATWTDLPYNAVEGRDWATFDKANVNIPVEFMGKSNVTFALRYTATTKSSTWEVKNFIVASGKISTETPDSPDTPSTSGRYTVSEAIAAFTGTATPATVVGYIVGTIDGKSITDGAVFSGAATTATNLLIADNADETDINNCLPVQLPSGDVRAALNLVDNPGNYKRLVALTGSLEKYFGVPGLKSVNAYEFDGEATDPEPEPEPEDPSEPDTPSTPSEPEDGENYLVNASFEEWNGNTPASWGGTGNSAQLEQSTDAHSGSYAVVVNGNASQNKRLASASYTLPAGTYNLSAYLKKSGDAASQFRLGYIKLTDGAIANSSDYIYLTDPAAVSADWSQVSAEFTLDATTEIAIIVMNSRVGKGAPILVDDMMLYGK